MLHTRLVSSLRLCRQLPRMLLRTRQDIAPKSLRLQAQLFLLRRNDRRKLSLHLRKLLRVARLLVRLVALQQRLPLRERGPLLLNEILAPVRQRRRQRRPHQPARRRRKHAQIALMLQIAVQPRLPALGQTRLHHALRCGLLQMRHALL
eukprot:scaffold7718_cov62-Phaeocystis_antarctica.AAC.1